MHDLLGAVGVLVEIGGFLSFIFAKLLVVLLVFFELVLVDCADGEVEGAFLGWDFLSGKVRVNPGVDGVLGGVLEGAIC